jgi:hypothetical protein
MQSLWQKAPHFLQMTIAFTLHDSADLTLDAATTTSGLGSNGGMPIDLSMMVPPDLFDDFLAAELPAITVTT